MKSLVQTLLVSALAATAGGAAGAVSVNGTDISAGSGDGWTAQILNPDGDWYRHVHLTNSGPFVVSGTDVTGKTVLCAETDCTVVVSNLVLSNAGSGYRLHRDGIGLALAVATNGTGRSVAVFPDGLYHSSGGIGTVFPDDPAAAYCSRVFTWSDVWDPSNVSWTPHETNSAAVVWTGERFVAARFRGGFMVSEDGDEWRAAQWDGHPVNLRAVARNPASGTLVAASTEGLWRSADGGLSWVQSTNLSSYAVVRSDGLFVAVGNSKGAPQGVFWSGDDGATWRARYFSDQNGALYILVAGGDGRFLAGGPSGWRALHLENGEIVSDGTASMSASKFAVASDGGGSYVACAGEGTGLRESDDGLQWTRSGVTNSTFCSLVFRGEAFDAEGVTSDGRYTGELLKERYDDFWHGRFDDCGQGRSALLCGTNAVKLVVSGTGNRLVGGPYVSGVSVQPGGTLELSAEDAGPAALEVRGGCYGSAIGGGWFDCSSGSFVQRSATLFARGGAGAPDIGPGPGSVPAGPVTILGGSLRPYGGWIDPAPSNGVEEVRCVVVKGLAPGEAAQLANLPADYGTDGVVADADGCVYLWLPEAAESFRFIAGGSLRRVAAGGGETVAETLPDPKVETAAFAPAEDGSMTVTLRVSSPVEAEALAPVYATDLSALAAGGGSRLAPSRVERVDDDEYEVSFNLPAASDSGFFVIQAK